MAEWTAGPVTLEVVTVLGQYDPENRWNGWLNPWIDAWSAVNVLEAVNRDPEYYQDYGIDWRFEDDGTLVLIERQWQAEDPNYQPSRLTPDEDGLYALGYYGWTWAEDRTYYHSEEWKAWDKERLTVYVAASNESNQRLSAEGVANRFVANEQAAQAAMYEWEKTHPEPPTGLEDDKS